MEEALQWCHMSNNVSDHQPLECLFNRLFGITSKKHHRSALLALCEGNPPVTYRFPSQRVNNAENISISSLGNLATGILGIYNIPLSWHESHSWRIHYSDVIMSMMASQIISLMIVYSNIYSGADLWKHQSSASLAFVGEIHRWPVTSPHKGPVTQKCFHLMSSWTTFGWAVFRSYIRRVTCLWSCARRLWTYLASKRTVFKNSMALHMYGLE